MTSITSPDALSGTPRVLLVDDQHDILELLVLLLEGTEFDVVTAADGEAGLAVARRSHFDAFVLDVTMPKMDGIELAQALRADPEIAAAPILFHTSLTESQVRDRFTDYDAHLRKPVDPAALISSLRACARRRSAETLG